MRLKKIITSCLLVLVGFGCVFSYKFMWGKPFTLNQLYLRTFVKVMYSDPETLTQVGLLNNSILNFYNDDLTDVSPSHQKETIANFKNDLKTLTSFNASRLNEDDKLSYDMFKWFLSNEVEGEKFIYHNYPVNQYDGIQIELPELLISQHSISTKGDAKDYIERLSKIGSKYDGLIEGLKLRKEKGIVPPKFILTKAITETNDFLSVPSENNSLLTSFSEKLNATKKIDAKAKKSLYKSAKLQMDQVVYPSYKKLLVYLEKLKEIATNDAGVWKLPNGDAYYSYKLKSYTTTDMSPEQIHQLGLKEVSTLHSEMQKIINSLGQPNISPGEFMKQLSQDLRFKYPNSSKGRVDVINDYKNAIALIDKSTSPCFDIKPMGKVEVQAVADFKESGSSAVYLHPTNKDGSKPSILFVNLGSLDDILKYSVKSNAAHETIPGHHIQRGLQRQMKDVPLFRTVVPFTAFAEGWATYSERLAWEQSHTEDPYETLGMLQSDLWRTARLVVDTGIHYKHWTREQAIKYMVDTVGMPQSTATIEVERYIVDPGQACAYKIGTLKFIELREKCRKELGSKFDIKEFHNIVLKNGAMPLKILEEQVNKYISSK